GGGGSSVEGSGTALGASLGLLGDALAAVDDPASAREIACVRLATLLSASAAAYLQVDVVVRTCKVVCWPVLTEAIRMRLVTQEDAETVARLMRYDGPETLPVEAGADPWPRSVAITILAGVLLPIEFAQLPLGLDSAELRLMVFAKKSRFTAAEVELLAILQQPVAALDRHLCHLEARPGIDRQVESNRRRLAAEHGVTPRELQVLGMLSEGLLAQSIASRLSVSPRTVHKHLGSLYRKLNAHDRLVAVNRAQAIGLLPIAH
ncbi:helix-turn-helix transcriptional regulator, partial [Streptomyces ureilyticus]